MVETDDRHSHEAARSQAPVPTVGWRELGLIASAGAALAGCGGGDGAPPEAFLQTADAQPMRHLLQATNSELSAAPPTVLTPTPTELMDWAERQYPDFFPPHQADLVWAPYVYRHYPTTGNYVGVAKGRVYIMGPVSGGPLADVGELTDFSASVFATVQAFDDAQAARFLAQATLGYTDADIVDVRSMAFEPWLAREFDKPLSSGNWAWLVAKGVDLDPQAVAIATYVDEQIWQRLLSANDGLRQRVALALSEIFVVGFDGISGPYKQFRLAAWWDLLAEHAFGNYRDLLEAVTLNPAMGSYLNTAGNQKEDPSTGRLPDENYAREVMQLFTIGLHELELDGTVRRDANGEPIETYTQDMVSQLARAFTGWNLDRPRGETGPEFVRRPMTLNPALHSTLGVSFLGQTIPAGTDGVAALKIVLDTLAGHANVGPFIGRQLIQKLVTSNPSPAYVARVAGRFNDNGQGVRGDLKAVVRAVLLDDEARGPISLASPSHGKLREPMLRLIQWARSFKASSSSGEWKIGNVSNAGTALGQSPLRSPSVFNFFRPGYVPAGTTIADAGLVAPEFQLANESSVAGYLNYMFGLIGAGHRDVRPNYAAELALAANATALVDRIDLLLCAGQLKDDTRNAIVNAVTSIAASNDSGKTNRVITAVMLVMASPDYLVQK